MSNGPRPRPKTRHTVPWQRRVAVYQIYPRSFKDTDGDGVGDLRGVIEKLDYLKDLGIGAIWLSPVYTSPMVDFGHDVEDYMAIDPRFGTMEDFETMVHEAHERDIHVLMDFVPNHSSDQHVWFSESRATKDNPKRDWYIWADPKPDGSPPNNWISVFGGPSWTLDPATNQYYLHTFLKEQPDLNWRNPNVREAMQGVLDFWIHKGVDGFRTDAVYHLFKDEAFRDEPINPNYVPGRDDPYNELLHIHTQGRDEVFEVVKMFAELMAEHDDHLYMMLEAYLGVPGIVRFYEACRGHGLVVPFNFNLLSMPWNARAYQRFIDGFESALDPADWPNWVLGNHDRSRVATRLGEDRARLAALLLLTLRGMPIIYYGDEIGMTDVTIPLRLVQDPFEKNEPGFGLGRDPERTPMQWDSSPNAGFSKGAPWLPVAKHYEKQNVEQERKDPASMLSLYTRLLHLRADAPALLEGTYRAVDTGTPHVLGYLRETAGQRVLVLANFSPRMHRVRIDAITEGRLLCTTVGDGEVGTQVNLQQLHLRKNEGLILEI